MKIKVMSVFGTRPETVKAGTVKVIGVNAADIYNHAKRLLTDRAEYDRMARAANPYGDGQASKRIVKAIFD